MENKRLWIDNMASYENHHLRYIQYTVHKTLQEHCRGEIKRYHSTCLSETATSFLSKPNWNCIEGTSNAVFIQIAPLRWQRCANRNAYQTAGLLFSIHSAWYLEISGELLRSAPTVCRCIDRAINTLSVACALRYPAELMVRTHSRAVKGTCWNTGTQQAMEPRIWKRWSKH